MDVLKLDFLILFYDDTGSDDKNRILIFTTDRNIEFLNSHPDWYGDGTFDVSPELFKQLFTIQACVKGKVLPMVYALIPNKQQVSYMKLFTMLKEYLNPPDSFSCDFEKGLLNPIKLNFENCKVLGCWFHLSQNLWKHVQSYGLVEKYSSDKEFYKAFQRLKALPFVPCVDVVYAFKVIKCNSPVEFNLMLEYFETYYIGKLKINSKSVREEPMFAIEIWNVYDRIEKDLPRTNNNLEAWHKVFGVRYYYYIFGHKKIVKQKFIN